MILSKASPTTTYEPTTQQELSPLPAFNPRPSTSTRIPTPTPHSHSFPPRYDAANKDAETYVVQRYISNPYLVSGRKFDIRMYCLVTSYLPLTVWMHRSGFCRFSSTRYSSSATTMADTTMHLTNVAIQKKAEGYDHETGGKWNLRDLKLYLMSRYGTAMVNKLFYQMHMVMMKCLFSVQSVMMNDKHCFELYGFDIIFDDSFKVYVIEVNASPSMSANTEEDKELKVGMLSNAFDIIDLEGNMQGNEIRVGGFDLVHRGGPVMTSPNSQNTTNLGCDWPSEHIQRCTAKGGISIYQSGSGNGGNGGKPPPSSATGNKRGEGAASDRRSSMR